MIGLGWVFKSCWLLHVHILMCLLEAFCHESGFVPAHRSIWLVLDPINPPIVNERHINGVWNKSPSGVGIECLQLIKHSLVPLGIRQSFIDGICGWLFCSSIG